MLFPFPSAFLSSPPYVCFQSACPHICSASLVAGGEIIIVNFVLKSAVKIKLQNALHD